MIGVILFVTESHKAENKLRVMLPPESHSLLILG